MTKDIEIDPTTVEPVYDLEKSLDKIHKCLQQLKDGLLPPDNAPWPVPQPPHGVPYGYGGGNPKVPDDLPLSPEGFTPASIFGTTVLKPLLVPPVTLNVNQVLRIGFQLVEEYPFSISSPYPFTAVTVTVDTAPFGGVANIGLPGAGGGVTLTGFTDLDGIVRFNVIGLRAGAASLVATALSESATVGFTVS